MKRDKLRGWSPAELRFHLKRAGSIEAFCKALNMNKNVLYRVYTPETADDLYNGRAVMIGGILVKKCICCKVTKSVNDFWADEKRNDGIRSSCASCTTQQRKLNKLRAKNDQLQSGICV